MTSFLQYGSLARHGPGFRPVVIGALTCGALMLSAGAAQASHRMADGTLCPHAAGTDPVGESAPQGTMRAGSTAPIGRTAATSQPARPAAQPASKAPAQRPAVQTQAQRPATSQANAQVHATAQAQRPTVAAQRVASKASAPAAARRQLPVTKPSASEQPRAAASKRATASRQLSRRAAVEPGVAAEIATDRRAVPAERPAAAPVIGGGDAERPITASAAMLLGLLAVCAAVVAGMAVGLRHRGARRAATERTFAESMDAAIEAELQAMISEARAHAMRSPEWLGDASDERELSQRH